MKQNYRFVADWAVTAVLTISAIFLKYSCVQNKRRVSIYACKYGNFQTVYAGET